MAVEYRASTMGNMNVDDSKIAYKQYFGEGDQLRKSVFALRNNPFKVATVCIGLLCVLLVAGVIGQSVHYKNVSQEHQNTVKAMTKDKEGLQQNLKAVQTEKKGLEANRNDLQRRYEYANSQKNTIQTNNNLLTEESKKLKESQSKLQETNTALTQELEKAKKLKDEAETNSNALSTAKHLIQDKYDSLVKRRNELQINYNSVTRERDILQNKFNNATRSRDKLQISFNEMITKVEHLQDKYNYTTSEKDKIASSHQNLTAYKDTLEATYNLIKKAEEELRISYESLVKEKTELESSLKNATEERDMLRVKNDNLTAERNQLQENYDKLNATIQAAAKQCPSGWKKFQNNCYYVSMGTKTWSKAREYCQNRDADLVIINSREEMSFINSLFTSSKEVWIGLSDQTVEGQWNWVDGTRLGLSFWGSGQPNSHNGNQDCVEMWHQGSGIGEWNDESCSNNQAWVCEL